jgi:hypothetical protein
MNERIQSCFKGIYVAILSVVIYAVALGCFISLMLLVISMEEGGSLSSLSVTLTSAVVLLSQGIGFSAGSFLISLVPLLLSISLLLLIRAVSLKVGTSLWGFLCGLVTWVAVFAVVLHAYSFKLLLPVPMQFLCIAGMFSFAYLWAWLPQDAYIRSRFDALKESISAPLRHTVWLSIRVWFSMMIVLLICGTATVIVWIVLNVSTMGTVFAANDMGSGSRIMTTLASLAWLPNACLWAISWLSGAGFSIGDSAHFSLWVGQSTDLPPIPVFGLLPSALNDDVIRLLCMSVPVFVAFVFGMLLLLHPKAFRVLGTPARQHATLLTMDNLKTFGYPAISFCLISILIALSSSGVFSLSNGALGSHHLAHVGVDVAQTTSRLVHSIVLGLAISWAVVLALFCARFAIRWFIEEISNRADISTSLTQADEEVLGDKAVDHKSDADDANVRDDKAPGSKTSETHDNHKRTSARVVSGTSGHQHGTEAFNLPNDSNPHPKEEQ